MKKIIKLLVISILIFGTLPIIGKVDASETNNEENSKYETGPNENTSVKSDEINLEGLFHTSAFTGELGGTKTEPIINQNKVHFSKPNPSNDSALRQSGSLTSKIKYDTSNDFKMSGTLKGVNQNNAAGLSISFHEEDSYKYKGGYVNDIGVHSGYSSSSPEIGGGKQGLDKNTAAVIVEYDTDGSSNHSISKTLGDDGLISGNAGSHIAIMKKQAGTYYPTRMNYEYVDPQKDSTFELTWNNTSKMIGFTFNGHTLSYKVDLPKNTYITIGYSDFDAPTDAYFQLEEFDFDNLEIEVPFTKYYTIRNGEEVYVDNTNENTYPLPGEKVYANYQVKNSSKNPIETIDIPANFTTSLNESLTDAIANEIKVNDITIDNPNDYLNDKFSHFNVPLTGSDIQTVDFSFTVPENGNYINDVLDLDFTLGQYGMIQTKTSEVLNIRAVPVISATNNIVNSTEAKKIISQDMLVAVMNAKATYKGENIDLISTSSKFEDIKKGVTGTYDVELSSTLGGGASETVKLTIVSDDTIITPDRNGFLQAFNKQITTLEAKALANEEVLVKTMNASAQYDGNRVIPNVTAEKFNDIKAGTAGTYDIRFDITEGGGLTKLVKLTVVEDDSIITPDGKGYVQANNKQIKATDAKVLVNKEDLIQTMQATAVYDGNIVKPSVTTEKFDDIKAGIIGTYQVSFNIKEGGGATKEVELAIIEDDAEITPDNKGYVQAFNTQIKSYDAKLLANENALIQTMKARASYDGSKVVPTVTASEFAKIKAGTIGTYKVSFNISEGGGASKKVRLTVVEDDAIITPDKKGFVHAINKQITTLEAKNLVNKEALIQTMYATAKYDGIDVVPNVTTGEFNTIKLGTPGNYEIMFDIKEGNGASKEVILTVLEDDAIVTPDKKGFVNANNVQITSTKAKEFKDKDELIKLMDAKASYDGSKVVPIVNTIEFDKIKAGTIGIYDISFSISEGGGATKICILTIIDDDAVVTPDEKGSVFAKNKQITSTNAKQIATIDELIKLMGSRATYNGEVVTPNVIANEFAQIQAGTIGIYEVTFNITEGNGASKTVKFSVIEDEAVITENDIGSVYAKNKQITSTEAKSLENKESLIELMSARATYDGSIIAPKVTTEEFKIINDGTIGIYDVTFSITEGNGASKTVKLVVMHDDSVVTPDSKGHVYANDTEITSSQAKKLTNESELIRVMNSSAAYDGIAIVPTVEATEFNAIKIGQVGTYDVVFSINEGDAATTNVKLKIVKDEVITNPEIGDTSILATIAIYVSATIIVVCIYTLRKRKLS